MSQLTFQACVFSGVICSACRVALDNVQMRPSKLEKHRTDHHPDMTLDASAELARVKDIMNDAAKCLAAFRNDNNGKLQFCEMFLTQADVLWCSHPSCGRGYKNERVHSGRDRTEHRRSNHFSERNMKYPKMASCPRIFFAENEWNYQSYKSKFSNLFRRARQAVVNQGPVNINMPTALMMQVRNRNPLLRSAGNPFQDDDNCLSTMILQSVRPKGPNCLPKSSPIITQMAEGQQSEVETEFCLNGEADYCNAAAFFERQHIAPSLGGHTQLLHFENEVGLRAFVCKQFEGSYPRFTYFASMYTSPPGAMWEKGLARAFFQFYHLANEQIDSISPTVRSQLMVIGDGTGSRILTRITQGANEVTDIVDELVGESADDNMEEGGIRAAELKQRYEKFAKDVIEMVGGQNGQANAGRAYLQRINDKTFKKYRRVGMLFVLFVARTLQAAGESDEQDSNVLWWHQVGRKTLEVCMTELSAQHEQQQANNPDEPILEPAFEPILKRATTVVMKLLLIALELQTDRAVDYNHQLGVQLPLCSQFLLCRTIHIHGSFIIRPTSPGRAQSTGAALMNVLRVTVAAAMVHAAEAQDQQLQQSHHFPHQTLAS